MKTTFLIIALVALVGCGKSLEDTVVGKYSAMVGLPAENPDGTTPKGGGDRLELSLRDGGIAEWLRYDGMTDNHLPKEESKWSLKNDEIHLADPHNGDVMVFKRGDDGDLEMIAEIDGNGKREKADGLVFKKVK